jgi:hypothetical protein
MAERHIVQLALIAQRRAKSRRMASNPRGAAP